MQEALNKNDWNKYFSKSEINFFLNGFLRYLSNLKHAMIKKRSLVGSQNEKNISNIKKYKIRPIIKYNIYIYYTD